MAPKSVFVKAQEMKIVFNEEYDNEQLEALRRAMEDCGSKRGWRCIVFLLCSFPVIRVSNPEDPDAEKKRLAAADKGRDNPLLDRMAGHGEANHEFVHVLLHLARHDGRAMASLLHSP